MSIPGPVPVNHPDGGLHGDSHDFESGRLFASGSGEGGGLEPILEAMRLGERFLVCSHSRPDGDAVGSMLALGMLLRQMGKHVDLVAADRVPAVYRGLPGADEIRTVMRVRGLYDAAILLECDGLQRTRLHGLERMFVINIDHHASGRNFGQLNWIDPDACSVGELVYRLAQAAGATVTPEMATCLYTTLLTDTGGFCYGGIQARTFALAGELTAAGADPVRVARDVYFANPLAKVMLMGAALSTLHKEGALAWAWVTHADMVRLGAAEEDCEGIVNYALSVVGVAAAALLRELPEGRIRVSLRSKTQGKVGDKAAGRGAEDGPSAVNVAAIAERLGGGGHENAAGCTLEGPMARAKGEILAALREGMRCAAE
jgi:phosphoesterase RecJ-like protein